MQCTWLWVETLKRIQNILFPLLDSSETAISQDLSSSLNKLEALTLHMMASRDSGQVTCLFLSDTLTL
jgi:hypothetical protein